MELSQWLGLWLFIAFVTSLLDYQKGRSGWTGLILGLTFGPLGLLFVMKSEVNGPALELRGLKRGRLKKCPQCAKAVYAGDATCRFCGHEW